MFKAQISKTTEHIDKDTNLDLQKEIWIHINSQKIGKLKRIRATPEMSKYSIS